MRSLCLLPGGLGRFVPCSTGANHCRLRHIGWEKCGHGLLLDHVRVLLCIFWMSFWLFLGTLLVLGVLYLLVLFHLGIALLGLPA